MLFSHQGKVIVVKVVLQEIISFFGCASILDMAGCTDASLPPKNLRSPRETAEESITDSYSP